ncbi:hypothetical protein ACS0TY_015163 [Phlomoides rotata]
MSKMLEMKKLDESAWKWLDQKPASEWSKSHFSDHPTCDMLLNNMCESFNSCILDAREKPILTMLEWIREWLMVRFQHNRDTAAMKWKGRVCPKIRQILNKHIEALATCRPNKADNIHYQVRVNDGSQHTVNLEDHTCSCRLWELSGIPCKHVISAITHQMGNAEDYVSDWYTVETYKKSYANTICPINGEALWANSIFIPPLPPNMGRRGGRSEKARRHDRDEPMVNSKRRGKGRAPTALKRRTCGVEDHNNRLCGGVVKAGSSNTVVDEPSDIGRQVGSQPRVTRSRSTGSQGGGSQGAGSHGTPRKSMRTKTLARKKLVHNRHPVAEQNEGGSSRKKFKAPRVKGPGPSCESEIVDMTIPTQESQAQATLREKVQIPGLHQGSSRARTGVNIGGPSGGGFKFVKLTDLQSRAKGKN